MLILCNCITVAMQLHCYCYALKGKEIKERKYILKEKKVPKKRKGFNSSTHTHFFKISHLLHFLDVSNN